jgi:MraZ protein
MEVCGDKWENVGAGEIQRFMIKNEVEQMFLGHYEHNIDDKGRMTIPVRFRELLDDGAYITQGFELNLIVMTAQAFQQMYQKVNNLSFTDPVARRLKRLMFSNANKVEFDKAGRILIPNFLREAANLQGEAVVVGTGSSFEIWSPELWGKQDELLQDTETNNQLFSALDLSFQE